MSSIIYLHGFASKGDSEKSRALQAKFGKESVFAPDLPNDPDEVVKLVTSIVHSAGTYPVVFVGTSLGGFWANYFAHKFDAPCVLINPSTSPEKTMATRIGQSLTNYYTDEEINITTDTVAKFKQYKDEAALLCNGLLINVFLAKDDDVIDYTNTLADIKFYDSLVITEDGGHRYNTHWNLVLAKVDEIVNAQLMEQLI